MVNMYQKKKKRKEKKKKNKIVFLKFQLLSLCIRSCDFRFECFIIIKHRLKKKLSLKCGVLRINKHFN